MGARMVILLRRLVMTLIAAAAVGGLIFAFSGPSGDATLKKPTGVEAVFPEGGDLELRQVMVVADLAPGYTGYLAIDDVEVPEDDLQIVPALNTVTLRPQPGSDFQRFQPGPHCATVYYRPIGERRDNSSLFRWCFRLH